jgi:hypothetical protein
MNRREPRLLEKLAGHVVGIAAGDGKFADVQARASFGFVADLQGVNAEECFVHRLEREAWRTGFSKTTAQRNRG